MSISGNLNTMEVGEILQWLSHGNKTGALVINDGEVEKRIYFRNGRVFSSSSTDPREYLGHFLVSYGFISEMELVKAVEMQDSNKMLLGKILVTIGAISEPDLTRLLRLKAQESIYDLFSWNEAEFRFLDGDLPKSGLIPIDLDVAAVIMEGVRRADEWRRIREVIPDDRTIPVAVGDLTDPGIDPGALQILSKVNDDRTVEEICLETHSSDYRVCKMLFDQYQKGRVKFVKPRWDTAVALPANPGNSITAEALVSQAEKYLLAKDYRITVRYLRAARNLEPENRDVGKAVEKAESRIREALAAAGVRLEAVPKLNTSLEEMTASDLSPQEGFIITRIDGTYDLKSILKISPMQQLDGLLVFWRLMTEGHITLE
jgi:Domain of unknown function (DUF4388)